MKAILMNVSAKECASITSQTVTAFVRKTKPTLKPPFTVYIYCAGKKTGKVVGEFVCDEISDVTYVLYNQDWDYLFKNKEAARKTGLSAEEVAKYLGKHNGFVWHISNVIVYSEAKELMEFNRFCEVYEKPYVHKRCYKCNFFVRDEIDMYNYCACEGEFKLSKPPSSWCYVEIIVWRI